MNGMGGRMSGMRDMGRREKGEGREKQSVGWVSKYIIHTVQCTYIPPCLSHPRHVSPTMEHIPLAILLICLYIETRRVYHPMATERDTLITSWRTATHKCVRAAATMIAGCGIKKRDVEHISTATHHMFRTCSLDDDPPSPPPLK